MTTPRCRINGLMSAFILASLLAVAVPLPAAAQEVHAFNVSAQDPAGAIRAFGAQAGVQILASANDLKGKKFNPVRRAGGDRFSERSNRTRGSRAGRREILVKDIQQRAADR